MSETIDKINENKDTVEFLGLCFKMAMLYGLPVATVIIKAMLRQEITSDEIQLLKLNKVPAAYFPCLDSDKDGVADAVDPCPTDPNCR